MPNWVVNKITFKDTKEKTEEILNFIKGDEVDEEGKKIAIDFNKIIPMPKYIFKGSLGNEELKKYGKNNWYDWSIQNWGCKWNASRSNVGWGSMKCESGNLPLENAVFFETPWSTPIPIFEKLTQIFPNTDMELIWADEDIGHNIGKAVYENEDFYIQEYDAQTDGNTALEIYIELWGEDDCLQLDKYGNWQIVYA